MTLNCVKRWKIKTIEGRQHSSLQTQKANPLLRLYFLVQSHKTVEKSGSKEKGRCRDITVTLIIYWHCISQASDHPLTFFLCHAPFVSLSLHLLLLAYFNYPMPHFSSLPIFFLLSLIQESYDSSGFYYI